MKSQTCLKTKLQKSETLTVHHSSSIQFQKWMDISDNRFPGLYRNIYICFEKLNVPKQHVSTNIIEQAAKLTIRK